MARPGAAPAGAAPIDDGARGFSFQRDGPLDMRMGGPASGGVSAYDVVNEYPQAMLETILAKVRR